MAESADPPSPHKPKFPWPTLFQRSSEPLFLLTPLRRLRYVNAAWERLTGLRLKDVYGLVCRRRGSPELMPLWSLASALYPPPEVLAGQVSQARRPIPGGCPTRGWWLIDFFPLHDESGLLGILGKITVLAEAAPAPVAPLPEKLMALRQLRVRQQRLEQMTSEVPALRRVADQVHLAAQSRSAVLIVGERGTGKHWLARTIHYHGVQRERAFAALDCAGLPVLAVMGALFGVGGLARRSGVGTIYLAHLTELPRDAQLQLHDWLREESAERPRILASVPREPGIEIQAGRLVEELHCALSTVQIVLPPLRERLADLPLLVQWFLERSNAAAERRITGLSAPAWDAFGGYPWPGNLRELSAVLAASHARARGDTIGFGDLPAYVQRSVQLRSIAGRQPERLLPLDQLLEQVERRLILLALRAARTRAGHTRGLKAEAARLLGIWRPRLVRRMKDLNIPDD